MATGQSATAPLPRWTVADAVESDSCYAKLHILELWAGRESLSVLEVLDLDIPVEDRMWAASRMIHRHPVGEIARVLTLTRVITAYALPYEATREWAKRWLSGEDRTFTSAEVARKSASGGALAAKAAGTVRATWAPLWALASWAVSMASSGPCGAMEAERSKQIADVRTAIQSYEGAS